VAWARVVLDEAHSIRNPATGAAKAATALVARARWCATGTPILNGAADLFGLWRFLRYAPYARRQAFRALIGKNPAGLARMQAALAAVTLRRTKASAGLMAPGEGGGGTGGAAAAAAAAAGPSREPTPAALPHLAAHPPPLPPRTSTVQAITLPPLERACYDALASDARAQLAAGLTAGSGGTVKQLVLLLRLRQACIHPALAARGGAGRVLAAAAISSSRGGGDGVGGAPYPAALTASPAELAAAARLAPPVRKALLEALNADAAACPLCGDVPEGPVITPCGHVYCRACAVPHFFDKGATQCKTCGILVSAVVGEDALLGAGGDGPAVPEAAGARAVNPAVAAAAAILAGAVAAGGTATTFRPPPLPMGSAALSSAKLDAVWTLLAALAARNRAGRVEAAAAVAAVAAADGTDPPLPPFNPNKAIVFSQFTSALDVIDAGLAVRDISSARVDGTMPPTARAAAVALFEDPASGVDVISMSIKAASLGLNLTAANHVVITDPWWAPAVEDQAADRAHRLGQTRPVRVTRFIVAGSVEERVLVLQERKRALAAAALGGGAGHLSLAGNPTSAEMRFLFGVAEAPP
jgi:SNF2 family DNA or RNA helicase